MVPVPPPVLPLGLVPQPGQLLMVLPQGLAEQPEELLVVLPPLVPILV
jgi:hypothetical protein